MRIILIVALATIALDGSQPLRVTVYNRAAVDAGQLDAALDQVAEIFREARIDVTVRYGDLAAPEALLMMYASQPTLDRLPEAICRARTDVALEILGDAPPGVQRGVLGMAQPLAPRGLNARVFVDHIRYAAKLENRPVSQVLAYAVAHEVGHVLLKTETHEPFGLMAATWTDREYTWMSQRGLLFRRDQKERMQLTLSRAGCEDSLQVPKSDQQLAAARLRGDR